MLFELHRREGGGKGIHCSAQNAVLFVNLHVLKYLLLKCSNTKNIEGFGKKDPWRVKECLKLLSGDQAGY